MRRRTAAGAIVLGLLSAPVVASSAWGCNLIEGCADQDGASVGLPGSKVAGLPKAPGGTTVPTGAAGPVYEYKMMPDCDANDPDTGVADMNCARSQVCPVPPSVSRTSYAIWRRVIQAGKPKGPWERVGETCSSDVTPASAPGLSMAMITAEFTKIGWARPVISTQPKGDVTLVNLKTFYQATWSQQGYEPGETSTKTLLGVPLMLRPKLVGFTYDFGDGDKYGPTTSLGGVWPDGDVTHTYLKRGAFNTRVITRFGAEFSLDGGRSWERVPATVDVPGPVTTVTVKEKRAVLVNR